MKSILRKTILKKRNDTPWEEIRSKSQLIIKKILELPIVVSSSTIFTYVSYNKEVITHDLIVILLDLGKNVLVPKVDKDRKIMHACKISDINELRPGAFGIPEPIACNFHDYKIDCAIIPGVAFDLTGARLGYGGGYYDKFLSKHQNIYKIAPCFDFQIVPKIPTEIHDVSMDVIITEIKTLFFNNLTTSF